MTDDEAIEFERLKTARDSLLLNVANLRGQLETIAAKEREACAKVCEDIYNDPKENDGYDCYYTRPYLECAKAIRARGQA
jgi:hypothetical protein